MREKKELLLDTRKYACERRPLIWWPLWSVLAVFVSLTTVACLDLPWLVPLPSSFLSGLLLVGLFILHYEFQHGTVRRRSPEAMAGIVKLQPPGTIPLGLGDIHGSLRLKFWCPQQDCTVTLKGGNTREISGPTV